PREEPQARHDQAEPAGIREACERIRLAGERGGRREEALEERGGRTSLRSDLVLLLLLLGDPSLRLQASPAPGLRSPFGVQLGGALLRHGRRLYAGSLSRA